VQPEQQAPLIQMIGGPLLLANALVRGPSADVSPRAVADMVQYLTKSRLEMFMLSLSLQRLSLMNQVNAAGASARDALICGAASQAEAVFLLRLLMQPIRQTGCKTHTAANVTRVRASVKKLLDARYLYTLRALYQRSALPQVRRNI
jgi:hypothetical protein